MNRIAVVAFALWTAAAFWAGREWRDRSCELKESKAEVGAAQAQTAAVQTARTTEQASAQTLATIATDHEEDRLDAETVPAAVAADLRDGNLRLRREWQGCEAQRLSEAAAAAGERDALTASRDALAGDLVRVARDADDQLRACQAVVLADRQQ